MKNRHFFSVFVILLTTSSINAQSYRNTVRGNSEFAFELYKKIYKEDKNIFISPYSISSALAMVFAGSKNETENQIRNVLRFESPQLNCHSGFSAINNKLATSGNDTLLKLSIANALWNKKGFILKPAFTDQIKKYYGASLYLLASAAAVNEWADRNTSGKIKKIVTEKDIANSALLLTNAIYFKGQWSKMFKEKDTKKDSFQTSLNSKSAADFMFQYNSLPYFEDELNQLVELPYHGDSLSMLIVLPKNNSSLSQLVEILDFKWYNYYLTNLVSNQVMLYLPKFTFNSSFELSNVLSDLGMTDAFDPKKADFSSMSDSKEIYIDKIIHKSVIEVNEKGSEAAAVTAVSISVTSALTNDLVFKANRPFLFLIRDKRTESVLFMGTLINPTE
jgi:serpin B